MWQGGSWPPCMYLWIWVRVRLRNGSRKWTVQPNRKPYCSLQCRPNSTNSLILPAAESCHQGKLISISFAWSEYGKLLIMASAPKIRGGLCSNKNPIKGCPPGLEILKWFWTACWFFSSLQFSNWILHDVIYDSICL